MDCIEAIRANLILAMDGTILETDEGILGLTGYSAAEMGEQFQNKLSYLIYVDDFEKFPLAYNRSKFQGEYFETSFRILKKDGGRADVFMYGMFTTHVVYGDVIRCVCVDVSARGGATGLVDSLRADLKKAEEKYRILSELQDGVYFEYDIFKDTITFFGADKAEESRICDSASVENFSDKILSDFCTNADDKIRIKKLLENPVPDTFEISRIDNVTAENSYWRIKVRPVNGVNDACFCILGTVTNINDEKNAEKELDKQDKTDKLTGLLKKIVVRSEIERILDGDESRRHAFIIVNIDNFTTINEHYGSKVGNALLMSISDSLKSMFRSTDLLGRIGGDRFLLFMKDIASMTAVMEKIREITEVFSACYLPGGKENSLSCSIGISRYPIDGRKFLELFFYADKALSLAKKDQGNSYRFFDMRVNAAEEDFRTPEEVFDSYYLLPEEEEPESSLDSELVGFTLDMINDSKDPESAICLILDRVGATFDVSNVSILECNDDNSKLELSYFWDYETKCALSEKYKGIGYANYVGYEESFDKDGIFLMEDLSRVDNPLSREFVEATGIKMILQSAIYKDGEFKGCISLHDTRKLHQWNRKEMIELSTVTKLVASYLLRVRASDEVLSQIERSQNYDALTGLPTLEKFKKNVTEYLAGNPDKRFALVYSDISNFKYVNDTLGYDLGDHILRQFARLIRENYASPELVGRVTSDNFIGLMEFENEESFKSKLLELNNTFNRKQKASNLNRNLVVISGACIIKDNGAELQNAIDNANIARKSAKGSMKTVCRFFNDEMEKRIRREMEITTYMERALAEKEFSVYLQPKYELEGGSMVGAEALIRWGRSDGTTVEPDDFIPLFEKNGFVVNVDFYVYEEVCRNIRKWLDSGKDVVPVSINVSRLHLNDEHFVENFIELVGRFNVPPSLLELEITESMFLGNPEGAMDMIKKLRKHGFGVAIDDFGSGFSSLNLLKDMETDVLKLDKEFFRYGGLKKKDKIILSNIINMAKQLNMKVLSEGVETKEQADFLREVRCDMVQGYFYSKPMPISGFETVMNRISNKYGIVKEPEMAM